MSFIGERYGHRGIKSKGELVLSSRQLSRDARPTRDIVNADCGFSCGSKGKTALIAVIFDIGTWKKEVYSG